MIADSIIKERDIEKKVLRTIKEFKLISKKDRVAVALSGGKDSVALLYILNKNFKNVFAIIIDEGISRRKAAEEFCIKNKIKYHMFSFKSEFKKTLPEMLKNTGKNPCSICGTLRRSLLDKKAALLGATKLATGHNLDDEVEVFFMNMFKSNINAMLKQNIKSEKHGFVVKIKPLMFCRNNEIERFVKLKKLAYDKNICRYQKTAFRKDVRLLLKKYEKKHKNIFKNVLKAIMSKKPKIAAEYNYCEICGRPSKERICRSCSIILGITKN